MSDIEIAEVRFSPPRYDEPDLERGERRAWTDVTIVVHNVSPTTTHFVRADLMAVQYEEGSRTLRLVLAEPPPDPGLHRPFAVAPHFLPVLPGDTAVIEESLPLQLNTIHFVDDGPPTFSAIDVSGVRRVEVTLAHDTTPFRPVHTEAMTVIKRQLHAWGQRVEHKAKCRIPDHPAHDASPHQAS